MNASDLTIVEKVTLHYTWRHVCNKEGITCEDTNETSNNFVSSWIKRVRNQPIVRQNATTSAKSIWSIPVLFHIFLGTKSPKIIIHTNLYMQGFQEIYNSSGQTVV